MKDKSAKQLLKKVGEMMDTRQQELLTKAQALHDIIERHPGLTGLMTDVFHGHLDDVIRNGDKLDAVPKEDLRKLPDEGMIEKYI